MKACDCIVPPGVVLHTCPSPRSGSSRDEDITHVINDDFLRRTPTFTAEGTEDE